MIGFDEYEAKDLGSHGDRFASHRDDIRVSRLDEQKVDM